MKTIRLSILAAMLGFAVTVGAQSPPIQNNQEVTPEIEKERAEQAAKEASPDIKVGKLYLAPLPILVSNPAYGFMYGVASSGSMFLGDPTTTNMSNALLTASYTTKNQLLFTLRGNVFTNENKWMLQSDYRLFFSSQPTYGLGTGSDANTLYPGISPFDSEKELTEGEGMDFDLIRFYQTALRQVKPNLYFGVGLHFDRYSNIDDHGLDIETGQYSHHYTYSMKHGFDPAGYTIAGVSANAVYDTRDNIANPYTGRFANVQYRYNADFLGSDQSSSTLWMEYRDYFSLSSEVPRNLIAVWTYANITTSGNLPYMALPAIGWDQMGKSGRAFAQGRWRGDDLFYAEAEYRFRLPLIASRPDLFGGVAFANASSASARDANVNLFDNWALGAGVGLRIQIQKATRTNLGIDYGWGTNGSKALYLNVTEYF